MAWAIAAAMESELFGRIIVTTDDEAIRQVALRCGADAPGLRPSAISDDHSGVRDAVRHIIRSEIDIQTSDPVVCLIYPTAAMVSPSDLAQALSTLESDESLSAVLAVTNYSHPVERAMVLTEDGFVSWEHSTVAATRTQDLRQLVHDAGQFCFARASIWLSSQSLLDRAIGLRLPRWQAIDVDEEEDWTHLELVLRSTKGA